MERQLRKLESQEYNKKQGSEPSFTINQGSSNTSNLNISQSSFNTSKAEYYTTILQVMRTDIIQLQDQINDNANIFNYLNKNSLTSSLKKRVNEIEESKKEGLKATFDKIVSDAVDFEKLSNIYKTSKKSELITKLSNEVFHYELLIKKINELFFVLYLSNKGEDSNSLKDSHSKISLILQFIDQSKSTSQEQKGKVLLTQNEGYNKTLESISSCKVLGDFFNSTDKHFHKIENIVTSYLKEDTNKMIDSLNSNLKLSIKRLENINDNYKLEILGSKHTEIDRALDEKRRADIDSTSILEKLKSLNDELRSKNLGLESQIEEAKYNIGSLKKELELKDQKSNEIPNGPKKDQVKLEDQSIKTLIDIINESKPPT